MKTEPEFIYEIESTTHFSKLSVADAKFTKAKSEDRKHEDACQSVEICVLSHSFLFFTLPLCGYIQEFDRLFCYYAAVAESSDWRQKDNFKKISK